MILLVAVVAIVPLVVVVLLVKVMMPLAVINKPRMMVILEGEKKKRLTTDADLLIYFEF